MALDLGVVSSSLSPAGGGLFYCMRVPTNMVADRGARVSVYGLLDDQFEDARPGWTVDSLRAFPTIGPRKFGFAPGMMRALNTASHDIVHLHGIWMYPSYVTSRWGRRTKVPTVISPAGMLDRWALSNSGYKKRLALYLYENANLHSAAAIHANSLAEVKAIRSIGLSNPIAVLPNGVDLVDLSKTPVLPDRMKSVGRKTLLFMGRIHPKKSLRELLLAWSELRNVDPSLCDEWRIGIAGWDDSGHQAEIMTLVRDLELTDSVTMLGPVFGDDKLALLRSSNAFILPSFSEGMPMAVLEAWSSGLPVFMTEACNLQDGFTANAAIEISTDPQKMARRLGETLADERVLQCMGEAAREHVERKYTWPKIVDGYMELYGWLAGGDARPDFVKT